MVTVQAHMIMEDHSLHYYFIGRLLGKALYENLLVELPLASFFLCKMSGGGIHIIQACCGVCVVLCTMCIYFFFIQDVLC